MKIAIDSHSFLVISLNHKEALDFEALLVDYSSMSLNPFRADLARDIAADVRSILLGGD